MEKKPKLSKKDTLKPLGVIYLSLSTKYFKQAVRQLWIYSGIVSFVLLALCIGASYWLGAQMTNPISDLAVKVRQIASGNLNISIESASKDEIGHLGSDLETMRVSIKDLTRHLEERVKSRTALLKMANQKLSEAMDALWGEMELAKKIQTALLPENPAIDGYEIATYMKPADDVGGDYYDVINVKDMDWVIIGDVSGHGVPAGLIMMMVQTSIQIVLSHHPKLPPSELLTIVNRVITKNIKRLNESKYMTITALAAHKNGKLFFSGLHIDILVYRDKTETVDIIKTNGIWIGIIDDISDHLQDNPLELAKGDTLLLYTDGLIEAKDEDGELYDMKKLQKTFTSLGKKPIDEIKQHLLDDIKDYTLNDDITIVVLRRLS